MAARDRMERGESADAARTGARRELGNEALIKEVTRQMWGWTSLEQLKQDLKYAGRMLLRNPGFAAIATLCLALGIGATTATFSIADALLLRPLPIAKPDEVATVNQSTPENNAVALSYPELQDLRRRTMPDAAGYRLSLMAIAQTPNDVPRMKMGMAVTTGFFQMLGVNPPIGRAFTAEESEVPGRGNVVLLSHEFWQSEFASNPSVIGRTVRINTTPVTVAGVLPEDFSVHPSLRPAYYVPFAFGNRLDDRTARNLNVKGRLKPGSSLASIQAEATALSKQLEEQYPESNRQHTLIVRTEFQSRVQQSPQLAAVVVVLWALAALVLAIASANIASLLLARASQRSREMAIRLSVGAGRARVLRQLLTESLALSALGAAAGVALAFVAIRYLASIQIPTDTPIVIDVRLDVRVLVFASLAAAATALLAGIVPAWRSLDIAIAPALKPTGLTSSTRWSMLGRNALVTAQVALSLVLLVASTAMLDAFRRMMLLDPGIRTKGLLMVEFDPSMIGYTGEQSRVFYRQLLERVRQIPGVRGATLARGIPFRPNFTEEGVAPEDYQLPPNQQSVTVSYNVVEEGYFETAGVSLVSGRPFRSVEGRPVAIVNEEFAKRYWPSRDPIGRRFLMRSNGEYVEVIGVARTGKYLSLVEAPQPYFYLPFARHPRTRMTLLAQTDRTAGTLTSGVLEAVRSLDANQPVFNVRDIETYFELGVIGLTLSVIRIVWCMGGVGLLLALIGLYGLVSYSTARRTREIGIRMALGADASKVMWLVLRQGLGLGVVGSLIGLLLAVPLFRALATAVSGVGRLSSWPVAAVAAGLLVVVAAACWIPARRAAMIDPNRALRVD